MYIYTYIQALEGGGEVQKDSDNVSDTEAENALGDIDRMRRFCGLEGSLDESTTLTGKYTHIAYLYKYIHKVI
jgi:hypothetical protein